MAARLKQELPASGNIEIIAAYASVLISYDPLTLGFDDICAVTDRVVGDARPSVLSRRRFVLPVKYGEVFGPDLEDVARAHNLDPSEVVSLHASKDYQIFCIGFSPGFPYLGGLPKALHTPRLDTPRTVVPAGSVAIGGGQTGVYPISMPGGWRIIGRTPLRLFDPLAVPPVPFEPGDSIRFETIDRQEFERLVANPEMPQPESIFDQTPI